MAKGRPASIRYNKFSDADDLEVDTSKEKIGWLQDAFSVLTDSPSDWYMILNERVALIDWDNKATTWALPLGNSMTFMFYVIRLLQDNLIKPNRYKFTSKKDAFDLTRSEKLKEYGYLSRYASNLEDHPRSAETLYFTLLSWLDRVFESSIVLMVIINLWLTYKFFWGTSKTYTLFNLKERPPSKNVTKHSLSGLNDEYYENIYNGSLWSMLKSIFTKKIDEEGESGRFYYALRKWVPSKFSTNLFISFCPSCLIFLLLTEVSFSTGFAVIIHQILLCFIVIDRFQGRLKDDSIINKAVMAEFEEKTVQPLTSKKFQDVQIDATPYGNGFVRFLPATSSSKSHIFRSHTLYGDVVTEKFNARTQEFEGLPENSNAHNVLVKPPQRQQFQLYNSPRDCQRCKSTTDAGLGCCHQNGAISPTRRMTPSGCCSPFLSSASDMSPPYCAGRKSPICMSSRQTPCQIHSSFMSDHKRKKSRSPLRQSILLAKNDEGLILPDEPRSDGSSLGSSSNRDRYASSENSNESSRRGTS